MLLVDCLFINLDKCNFFNENWPFCEPFCMTGSFSFWLWILLGDSDFRNSMPIIAYRTEMTTMGMMKKQNVEDAKAFSSGYLMVHSAVSRTCLPSNSLKTTPNWIAIGTAHRPPAIHTAQMSLTTLESLDIVWALIGWQIAKYRSMVKQVMVNIEALVDISEVKPRRIQKASPKT